MNAPTNDGGPAFPIRNVLLPKGMTLYDWSAGQALAGIAAHPTLNRTPADAARISYEAADAMLAARKNGGGS